MTVEDQVLLLAFAKLSDHDRATVSRVCRKWRIIEGWSRGQVLVRDAGAVAPGSVVLRFPRATSVTICGSNYDEYWGTTGPACASGRPWVEELVKGYSNLTSIHFKNVVVRDKHILSLPTKWLALTAVSFRGCRGISGRSLLSLGSLRVLTSLDIEGSTVEASSTGQRAEVLWLEYLVQNCRRLTLLNLNAHGLAPLGKPSTRPAIEIMADCEHLTTLVLPRDVPAAAISLVLARCRNLTHVGTGCFPTDSPAARAGPSESTLRDHELALEGLEPLARVAGRLRALEGLWGLPAEALRRVLPLCTRLESLDLRNVAWGQPQSAGPLAGPLLSLCTSLRTLKLPGVVGEEAVVSVVRAARGLTELVFERGERGEGSGLSTGALLDLARIDRPLRHLSCFVEELGPAAVLALSAHTQLERLHVQGCNLGDESMENEGISVAVERLLASCPRLTALSLQGNSEQRLVEPALLMAISQRGQRLESLALGPSQEMLPPASWERLAMRCPSLRRVLLHRVMLDEHCLRALLSSQGSGPGIASVTVSGGELLTRVCRDLALEDPSIRLDSGLLAGPSRPAQVTIARNVTPPDIHRLEAPQDHDDLRMAGSQASNVRDQSPHTVAEMKHWEGRVHHGRASVWMSVEAEEAPPLRSWGDVFRLEERNQWLCPVHTGLSASQQSPACNSPAPAASTPSAAASPLPLSAAPSMFVGPEMLALQQEPISGPKSLDPSSVEGMMGPKATSLQDPSPKGETAGPEPRSLSWRLMERSGSLRSAGPESQPRPTRRRRRVPM